MGRVASISAKSLAVVVTLAILLCFWNTGYISTESDLQTEDATVVLATGASIPQASVSTGEASSGGKEIQQTSAAAAEDDGVEISMHPSPLTISRSDSSSFDEKDGTSSLQGVHHRPSGTPASVSDDVVDTSGESSQVASADNLTGSQASDHELDALHHEGANTTLHNITAPIEHRSPPDPAFVDTAGATSDALLRFGVEVCIPRVHVAAGGASSGSNDHDAFVARRLSRTVTAEVPLQMLGQWRGGEWLPCVAGAPCTANASLLPAHDARLAGVDEYGSAAIAADARSASPPAPPRRRDMLAYLQHMAPRLAKLHPRQDDAAAAASGAGDGGQRGPLRMVFVGDSLARYMFAGTVNSLVDTFGAEALRFGPNAGLNDDDDMHADSRLYVDPEIKALDVTFPDAVANRAGAPVLVRYIKCSYFSTRFDLDRIAAVNSQERVLRGGDGNGNGTVAASDVRYRAHWRGGNGGAAVDAPPDFAEPDVIVLNRGAWDMTTAIPRWPQRLYEEFHQGLVALRARFPRARIVVYGLPYINYETSLMPRFECIGRAEQPAYRAALFNAVRRANALLAATMSREAHCVGDALFMWQLRNASPAAAALCRGADWSAREATFAPVEYLDLFGITRAVTNIVRYTRGSDGMHYHGPVLAKMTDYLWRHLALGVELQRGGGGLAVGLRALARASTPGAGGGQALALVPLPLFESCNVECRDYDVLPDKSREIRPSSGMQKRADSRSKHRTTRATEPHEASRHTVHVGPFPLPIFFVGGDCALFDTEHFHKFSGEAEKLTRLFRSGVSTCMPMARHINQYFPTPAAIVRPVAIEAAVNALDRLRFNSRVASSDVALITRLQRASAQCQQHFVAHIGVPQYTRLMQLMQNFTLRCIDLQELAEQLSPSQRRAIMRVWQLMEPKFCGLNLRGRIEHGFKKLRLAYRKMYRHLHQVKVPVVPLNVSLNISSLSRRDALARGVDSFEQAVSVNFEYLMSDMNVSKTGRLPLGLCGLFVGILQSFPKFIRYWARPIPAGGALNGDLLQLCLQHHPKLIDEFGAGLEKNDGDELQVAESAIQGDKNVTESGA